MQNHNILTNPVLYNSMVPYDCKPNKKETSKLSTFCKDEFKIALDGNLYYNPKLSQSFLLACDAKEKEQPKNAQKLKNLIETKKSYKQERVVDNEAYENMKAVGKTLTMSERKKYHLLRNKSKPKKIKRVGKEQICNCKRFTEKWERMNKLMVENNKAIKIQDRLEPSPTENSDNESLNNDTVQLKNYNIKLLLYKSYLQRKYRILKYKKNVTSDYTIKNPKEFNTIQSNTNITLPNIAERFNKKLYVSSLKKEMGSKSSDEIINDLYKLEKKIKEQEKVKRIKQSKESANEMIHYLSSKHQHLYKHVELMKRIKKTKPFTKGLLWKSSIHNITEESIPKSNIYLTEVHVPEQKHEDKHHNDKELQKNKEKRKKDEEKLHYKEEEVKSGRESYSEESEESEEIENDEKSVEEPELISQVNLEEKKNVNKKELPRFVIPKRSLNNNKVYLGSENLPSFLLKKLELKEQIDKYKQTCIEDIIITKWSITPKVKTYKADDNYYVITHGKECLLSKCCDSLVIIEITKESTCKVTCMNKNCFMKTLEMFLLSVGYREKLFPESKEFKSIFNMN